MQIKFADCEILGVDRFQSKKGTDCATLRWFDHTEHRVYRVLTFGDGISALNGIMQGMRAAVTMDVVPSRRDDSIELSLSAVTPIK